MISDMNLHNLYITQPLPQGGIVCWLFLPTDFNVQVMENLFTHQYIIFNLQRIKTHRAID